MSLSLDNFEAQISLVLHYYTPHVVQCILSGHLHGGTNFANPLDRL